VRVGIRFEIKPVGAIRRVAGLLAGIEEIPDENTNYIRSLVVIASFVLRNFNVRG
jgi:hypothetical protein